MLPLLLLLPINCTLSAQSVTFSLRSSTDTVLSTVRLSTQWPHTRQSVLTNKTNNQGTVTKTNSNIVLTVTYSKNSVSTRPIQLYVIAMQPLSQKRQNMTFRRGPARDVIALLDILCRFTNSHLPRLATHHIRPNFQQLRFGWWMFSGTLQRLAPSKVSQKLRCEQKRRF